MDRRQFIAGTVLGVAGTGSLFPLAAGSGPGSNQDETDEPVTPAPPHATVLFDGTSLEAWTTSRRVPPAWKIENGYLEIAPRTSGHLISKETYLDFQLHVEFWVPYLPEKRGQGRGNSGIYLQGKYEVQILDSYGLEPRDNDCGALYTLAAPLFNACKKPERWQSYNLAFRSPRFDDFGVAREKGRITVLQNRLVIHNNLEFASMTGHAALDPRNDPHQPGPIVLQDHGNKVRFRNIWIVAM